MIESQFISLRRRLLGAITEWLNFMNTARSVNWCECVPGELDNTHPTYLDVERGEPQVYRQTFPGRRVTLEREEVDPDRTIQIALGRNERWQLVAAISTSIDEAPTELTAPSDEALRHAIQNAHDRLFHEWPLTQEQFEAKAGEILKRKQSE